VLHKVPACLTAPGAGTALGVVAGALESLELYFDWRAAGGVSGGGLIALAIAKGMTPQQASSLASEILQRTDLLDKGWPFDEKPGLYRGKVIQDLFRKKLGDKTCMRDLKMPARVVAVDLAVSMPCIIDSFTYPDVELWRAAYATMAIEFFFDPIRLRENNARTYADGGLIVNVPSGLWDDWTALPTVALRFHRQHPTTSLQALINNANGTAHYEKAKVVRTWNDLVPAAFNTSMNAACMSLPCLKPREKSAEIVLQTAADGMKFGLSEAECEARQKEGRDSVRLSSFAHLLGASGNV
jgi:predicted acylesterase/phospholipase RssA